MPIYEYECTSCGLLFEKIQKHSDPHVETCEECGGKVKRRVSPPALQFKGTGWYITDYSDKGKKAKSSEKNASSKESSGGSDSKSKSSSSDGGASSTGD